jgi:hypothetical protein
MCTEKWRRHQSLDVIMFATSISYLLNEQICNLPNKGNYFGRGAVIATVGPHKSHTVHQWPQKWLYILEIRVLKNIKVLYKRLQV